MNIKISTIILCLIFLTTIASEAQQSDYDFYYSSDLQVGDIFTWTQKNNEISYTSGAVRTISSTSLHLEMDTSLEGVQATPLVKYENYFKFEINGTNQAIFDSYFDYGSGSNFGQFPLIYPDYRISGNNYFKTISSDPDFQTSGFSAEITGNNITFTYSQTNFDYIFNVTAIYQVSSGLLILYKDFQEDLNNIGHIYVQKKITINSFPLRYLSQSNVVNSASESSDLKTVDYSYFGSFGIFIQLSLIIVISNRLKRNQS